MKRQANPWFVAITVTIAAFMELLDTSIATVVLPMSAWLSQKIGRKNYYLLSVAMFTVSSFFCGVAPSLNFMLIARIVQGIGGGGLAPVAQAILVDTLPPAKRAAAFALYTVV